MVFQLATRISAVLFRPWSSVACRSFASKTTVSGVLSANDQFDDSTSKLLEGVYLKPDIIAQRNAFLRKLAPQMGDHALDIGCGPGLTTEALAQAVCGGGDSEKQQRIRGGLVKGVDIAQPMLNIAGARCKAYPCVELLKTDVLALPFLAKSFDVALAVQVYEYVEDIDAALLELRRVMRPQGRVLIIDTDWGSCIWQSSDDARMRHILDTYNTHIPHPRLPRILRQRMEKAGFCRVEVEASPLVNPRYSPDTYSVSMMEFIGKYVTGRNDITAEDVCAWKQDLHDRLLDDSYFFSLNRYLFVGHCQ